MIPALLFILFAPAVVSAHGFSTDGKVHFLDILQIAGFSLASLLLIAYCYREWQKEKKNKS